LTELVRYEAARRALAEAVAVDEVKQIHDQAEAMRHAARIARDKDLEIQAAQIRFRAERRLGELITAQKETVGLNTGSRGQLKGRDVSGGTKSEQPEDRRPTLAKAGIDRKLSSRAQRVADLPAEKFETLLEQHAEEMRAGVGRIAMDLLKVNADQEGRQARRDLAVQLSDASAALPTGRQYPVIYADPPWQRKQGVTSRSYENHYPTMTWSEICALPVKDLVLPDAWLFLWIPRAHAFALHEIETEVTLLDGEIARAKVKMPLAWAVAKSWGFDSYSTAFVWTKTDEEHPDEAGGAVLVRDQDELLLMFKRGRGLPKPDNGEKFGSNHRERSRPLGHSTKPQHYRRMIATMAGAGVQCLEMFARFDANNPPPPGWDLWGNQAAHSSDGGGESRPAGQPNPSGVHCSTVAVGGASTSKADECLMPLAGVASGPSETLSDSGEIGAVADEAAAQTEAEQIAETMREIAARLVGPGADAAPPVRSEEPLWMHPAIAGKHVITMTRDYPDGVSFDVATCQCGWKTYARAGIERQIDDQINAHWRETILASEAFAEPADEKVGGVAGACSALVLRREPDESLSREDEQIADSGKGDAFAADQPAAPAASPTPDDRIVDTVAEETPIRSETAVPPAGRPGPEILLSELDELRTVLDPTIPGRAEILDRVGKSLAAGGLAYRPVSNGDWVLSIKGRDRFRELGGELKARKPAPANEAHPLDIPAFLRRTVKGQFEMDLSTSDRAAPEVVDGKLQTRLPLTEGELEEQAAMLALKAEKKIDSEMLRHLVGRDFAWCTPSGRVHITDSGHAFLAQLVTPAPAAELEAST
jgi:N6-adenosine-specific RNA methylase IME4